MDYFLTEEQQAIRELARTIAENDIRPVAAEYDRTGDFPWPVVEKMAQSDLFGVFIDEEYGGLAGGARTMNLVLVTEELAVTDAVELHEEQLEVDVVEEGFAAAAEQGEYPGGGVAQHCLEAMDLCALRWVKVGSLVRIEG